MFENTNIFQTHGLEKGLCLHTIQRKKEEGNRRLQVVYSIMQYTKLRTGALRLLNVGIMK